MCGESSTDAMDALCGDCEKMSYEEAREQLCEDCDMCNNCDTLEALHREYTDRTTTFWEIMKVLGVNNGSDVIPKIKELMALRPQYKEAVDNIYEQRKELIAATEQT